MPLVVLGTNHNSVGLDLRERWSYSISEIPLTLEKLQIRLKAKDVALLSTCNRTEIYCDLDQPQDLIDWFNQEISPSTEIDINQHGYVYQDKDAVTHVMRVASGLDSLVIGEPQILGQFKQAYRLAKKANTIGKKFDKLFTQAISAAKTVRTYTDIGLHPVSVASTSVALLIQQLKNNDIYNTIDFARLKILLIGSGDTIKIIGKNLISKKLGNITITSRNSLHANDLAMELENDHTAINTENFSVINDPLCLAQYDVIFSATRSPVFVLSYDVIKEINRLKKLYLIDLAVPRDIDPKAAELENVDLYTVDHLKEILINNTSERQKAASYAEHIIAQYTNEFYSWEQSLFALASVCTYRQKAEEICTEVMAKAKRRLQAGQDPEEVLTNALLLLRNKLLHHSTMTLKSHVNPEEEVDLLKDFLNT